jgi:iron complex transport system substrate-binding protein
VTRSLAARLLAATLLLAAGCAPAPPPSPAEGPARRIVTLAPHLAELVYAAGAGNRLVGTVDFSNHPPAARDVPRVGDAFRIDLEALATLRPDLVLGWPSGNSPAALERLRSLGYRVVALEPRRLADVGDHLELIGRLAGTGPAAAAAAREWRDGLAALRARHAGARAGRVFYQIAPQPLITVTRAHFIGEAIELCGGENVYAGLPGLTAVVSVESVVAEAPDAIVANDFTRGAAEVPAGTPLDAWRSWTGLPAVQSGRLGLLDPDLMSVPGPRLLSGIRQLCAALAGPRLPDDLAAPAGPAQDPRHDEQQVREAVKVAD